jgi:hypothetical protein
MTRELARLDRGLLYKRGSADESQIILARLGRGRLGSGRLLIRQLVALGCRAPAGRSATAGEHRH